MNSKTSIILISFFLFFTANHISASEKIHQTYDQLLQKFVAENLVKYNQFHRSKEDISTLKKYIVSLEKIDPDKLPKKDALAYWINLYNAVTLQLILDNYPVESIKDIGGLLSSPWKKKLVTVNGEQLTLNQIENEIIRPKFKDARIHFALNCASIGCPPLAANAYEGRTLDEQLDRASKLALSNDEWVKISDKIYISKIFDWYGQDFIEYSGSVRKYIANYRPDMAETILDENKEIKFLDYNWKLNILQ